MDGGAVRGVGGPEHALAPRRSLGLGRSEPAQVVLADPERAGLGHLGVGPRDLGRVAGQRRRCPLGEVAVDPLGGRRRPTSSTVACMARRMAAWRRGRGRRADPGVRGGEERRAPAPVAARGAEAGHLCSSTATRRAGSATRERVGGPESGEAGPDDGTSTSRSPGSDGRAARGREGRPTTARGGRSAPRSRPRGRRSDPPPRLRQHVAQRRDHEVDLRPARR